MQSSNKFMENFLNKINSMEKEREAERSKVEGESVQLNNDFTKKQLKSFHNLLENDVLDKL